MKLIIGVLAVLMSFSTFSQSIKSSDVQNLTKKHIFSHLVSKDETGTYFVSQSGAKSVMLCHANTSLKIDRTLQLPVQKGKSILFNVVEFNNNIWVLMANYSGVLTAQKVDKAGFSLSSTKINLIVNKGAIKKGGVSALAKVSANGTKLLHYSKYIGKSGVEYDLIVFDEALEKVWSKSIVLSKDQALLDVKDVFVDDEGGVHFAVFNYKDKKGSNVKGLPNYTTKIKSYNATSSSEYVFESGDKFITDLKLSATLEGGILCAGFYSIHGEKGVAGTFMTKVTSANKKVFEKYHPFSLEYITEGIIERQADRIEKRSEKDKSVEITYVDLENLIIEQNGDVVLVGEQAYLSSVGEVSTTNFNELLVIKLDSDGGLKWQQKVLKTQVIGFLDYGSYSMTSFEGNLYFIFNDVKSNYLNSAGKIETFHGGAKESVLGLVKIDQDGVQSRKILLTNDSKQPKLTAQVVESNTYLNHYDLKKRQAEKLSESSIGFSTGMLDVGLGVGNNKFVEIILAAKPYSLNQTKDRAIFLIGKDKDTVKFYNVTVE